MKVGILTQPLRYNIGGLLQNYALQLVLKSMGHQPITLDPDPYYHASIVVIFKRIILNLFGNRVEVLTEKELNRIPKIKGKNSDRFIRKYIKCRRINNMSLVQPTDFDALIVGSDQVWRPKYNSGRLGNMFLDFAQKWTIKRISYAASFGTKVCEYSDYQRVLYGQLLKMFDAVSVRERSAVAICKDFFGVDAVRVLDPTLLLEKDDYIKIIAKEKVGKSAGELLVYFLDYAEDKNRLKDVVVKDTDLLPFYLDSYYNKQEIVPQISVAKWLRGFFDANLVLTDSFHACVFSIIFNKPFILYPNKERGMDRYISLFEDLGISNCVVYNSEDYNTLPVFDYYSINKKLSYLAKQSKDYLESVLK